MTFNLRARVGRWKTDVILAGQYLSPFITFITLASLLYASNLLQLQTIFRHYSWFLIVSVVMFLLIFKFGAKIIIWLKFYSAEQDYQREINPYEVDRANLKDKNYSIPLSLASIDLALVRDPMLIVLFDEVLKDSLRWKKNKPRLMKKLADLRKKRDKYKELLSS